MLSHKLSAFLDNCVLMGTFFLCIFLWSWLYHDWNKSFFKPPMEAFTEVTDFLNKWFWKQDFSIFLNIPVLPLVTDPIPGDHDFNKLEPMPTEDVTTQVTTFLPLVVENILFKDFFSKYLYVKIWPPPLHCGPNLPPGILIWTNVNLHHLMMLLHKLKPFWLNDSWNVDFRIITTNYQ